MLKIFPEQFQQLSKTHLTVYKANTLPPDIENTELPVTNNEDNHKIPLDNYKDEIMVGGIIVGMLFFAIIGLAIFIHMARNERSLHGTYSPQNAEFKAPIIEMTEVLKVPDERFKERLI